MANNGTLRNIRRPLLKERAKTYRGRAVPLLLVLLICVASYGISWMLPEVNNAFYLKRWNASMSTLTVKSMNTVDYSLPHYDTACSCWNATAPRHCCERAILRAHKFGTLLLGSLFGSLRYASNQKFLFQQISRYARANLPTKIDYRHVVVTRNWFEAIVSGYLYHKVGHECWLDNFGVPKGKNKTATAWHSQLMFLNMQKVPYPPCNHRSICMYLAQESEEDGIRVLMDIALSSWYKGVVPYWKLVQERLQQGSQQRSLFLCYEDLVDPFQQEEVYHQILEWLFPGQDDVMRNASMPEKIKNSLNRQQQQQRSNQTNAYTGGHATVQDSELRARLRAVVERYDREIFGSTVATSNAIFGCGA